MFDKMARLNEAKKQLMVRAAEIVPLEKVIAVGQGIAGDDIRGQGDVS